MKTISTVMFLFFFTAVSLASTDETAYKAVEINDVAKMEKILDKGWDINAGMYKNHYETSAYKPALVWASNFGHKEMVEMLLKKGASINIKDKDMNTPLIMAASMGHYDIVKILVEHGALIDETGKHGDTALMNAVSEIGYNGIITALRAAKNKKTMLENIKSGNIIGDKTNIVKLLLQKRASVARRDAFGRTPLIIASSNKVEIVQLLVNAGSDINAADTSGITPLIRATQANNVEVVKLLLGRGANARQKSKNGETAPFIAAKNASDGKNEYLQLHNFFISKGYTVSQNELDKRKAADEQREKENNTYSCMLLLGRVAPQGQLFIRKLVDFSRAGNEMKNIASTRIPLRPGSYLVMIDVKNGNELTYSGSTRLTFKPGETYQINSVLNALIVERIQ